MRLRFKNRPAQLLRRGWAFGLLLVFLMTSLVFGQPSGHWGLGPYQLVNGTSSGPLRVSMGRESLRSYRFVGEVGGVAFAGVAKPGPTLAGKPLRLVYQASKPDGQRLGIEVGGKIHVQNLPDWILLPVAQYADSEHHACVSLFGPKMTETSYDLVYHEEFENTLLGMRLLQADILFLNLNEMWRLPQLGGKTVLGNGEKEPSVLDLDREAAAKLSSILVEGEAFQSWVLTDQGESIRFDLRNGLLDFSGRPYYYFWREEGPFSSNGAPQVRAASQLTNTIKNNRETLRRFNQPVYDATRATMHYAALFRYFKTHNRENWSQFLASMQGVEPLPRVPTPVRWSRP